MFNNSKKEKQKPGQENPPEQVQKVVKPIDWKRTIDLHFNTIKTDGRQMRLTLYYAGLNDTEWNIALKDSDKIDSIKTLCEEYLDYGYDAIKVTAHYKNSADPIAQFVIRTSDVYMPLLDEPPQERENSSFNGLGMINAQIDSIRKDNIIERLQEKLDDRDEKIKELKENNESLQDQIDDLEEEKKILEAQVQKSGESLAKAVIAGSTMLVGKGLGLNQDVMSGLAGLIMGNTDVAAIPEGEQPEAHEDPQRNNDEKIIMEWIHELSKPDFVNFCILIKSVETKKTTFEQLIKNIHPAKTEEDVSAQD